MTSETIHKAYRAGLREGQRVLKHRCPWAHGTEERKAFNDGVLSAAEDGYDFTVPEDEPTPDAPPAAPAPGGEEPPVESSTAEDPVPPQEAAETPDEAPQEPAESSTEPEPEAPSVDELKAPSEPAPGGEEPTPEPET